MYTPKSRGTGFERALLTAAAAAGLIACGGGGKSTGSGGSPASNGGAVSAAGSAAVSGAGASSGGAAASSAGSGASAGSLASSGNSGNGSGASAGLGDGSGGSAPNADSGAPCTVGAWPAADPAVAGPFATVTENNVGPAAGVGDDGGAPVAFTMFRPKDLSEGGLCHPVITWGNGTGSNPSLYKVLLNHFASHGFVVIASDSPNVGQGSPAPMVVGVTWVLQQNEDPTSELYQKIDTAHIGATGHSQGAFATTTAGADSHITTIAPLCGASAQRNLHGPAWLFCGGMDTTVPCSTVQNAFNAISNVPIMQASYLSVDHASWITFRGTKPGPVEVAVTAWMRVQLMGDTSLRSWFYGASCKLCTDSGWQVTQKMMDQ